MVGIIELGVGVGLSFLAGSVVTDYLSNGCNGHHWDDGEWVGMVDDIVGKIEKSNRKDAGYKIKLLRPKRFRCQDCGAEKTAWETFNTTHDGELFTIYDEKYYK